MALPDYSQGSGFYDPSRLYTGIYPSQGFARDPMSYQIYGTQNPDSAYYERLTKQGLGGTGGRAQAAQGLLGMYKRGYGAAQNAGNVNLYFPEYLDQSRMMDTFNNMSYEQQGLQPGRYQNRYRWQFRPGG